MSNETKTETTEIKLTDCKERNRLFPDTFFIPSEEDIAQLKIDDCVKLIFDDEERMWVMITGITKNGFIGKLDNEPVCINSIKLGDTIVFEHKHIAMIYMDD